MKKKLTVLVVFVVMFAAMAMLLGSGAPKESKEGEELNFAFFIPHVGNEFMANFAKAFEAAGAERGVQVKVYSADNDPAKQISQIESAITRKIDGVFIEPVSFEGISEAIKRTVDAGIPVLTVHEKTVNQDICKAFVGTDLMLVGEKEMGQAVKDIGGKGNIALIYGGMGHPAQIAVTQGYQNILAENSDVKVILDGTGEWVAEKALVLAENWLSTGKRIDAVVCNNDGMAIGVMQALKSANKIGKIKLYGVDAVPQVLEAVEAGEMHGTIKIDNVAIAEKAVDAMLALKDGEEIDKEIIISPIVITKDNVDQYLK
jgi:ribose transport system substrate-binding protein/inositol transport system substrate-binding protein